MGFYLFNFPAAPFWPPDRLVDGDFAFMEVEFRPLKAEIFFRPRANCERKPKYDAELIGFGGFHKSFGFLGAEYVNRFLFPGRSPGGECGIEFY